MSDENLRRHMLAVGAAMAWYAELLKEDVDRWQAIGFLHDFDWEIHPDLDRHPVAGAPLLRQRGWDEEIVRTILSHYEEGTGVAPEQAVDFALLACDEITGLLVATTLVRPSRDVRDVKVKSVKKKWKARQFAAGVDRTHVREAVENFSRACFDGRLELWQHIGNVLRAMQDRAGELGLAGAAEEAA